MMEFDIVNDILPIEANLDNMTVEQIKQEAGWPLDYTSTLGIAPYIRRLGDGVSGIEIGTARGEGAYYLLETCPGIKTLHTIDPYVEYTDWIGVIKQDVLDRQRDIAAENFKIWGDRIQTHWFRSERVCEKFANDSQHFLFVDGDHSAAAVCADLHMYYPKVRKNGIVSGSNYNLQSVKDGLMKWREETKNRYPLLMTLNNVWFFYKR